jgi:dipeptidyl aminopeptidase/acylaminoacyl peptidase
LQRVAAWPELVTALDDPVSGVDWSPDGDWLAFSLAPGGGMNEQVYLVRPDGTGMRRLTEGGKENNRLGPWSHDGKRLALGSNLRSSAAIDAYIFDLASGAMRLGSENRGVGGYSDLSRDGRWALLSRVVSRGDNNLYLVDLESGKETLLTPHSGPGNFFGEFAVDGRAVYLGSDLDRDLRVFGRLPLAADGTPGAFEVLAERADAELATFEIDDAGRRAVLSWNVAGKNELAWLDLKTAKLTAGPKLPAEIAGGLSFSADGNRLLMVCSGSTLPADVWLYDLKHKSFNQLTHSPHAGVDLGALVQPRLVQYAAHDGLPLSGWLYEPRTARRRFQWC